MVIMNFATIKTMEGKDMNNVYAQRRERVREQLAKKKLSALLVSSAANRFYLSGFELHDPQPGESAGCLLIGDKPENDWLCTDARYTVAAGRLWNPDRVLTYGQGGMTEIGELLAREAKGEIGMEAKSLSLHQWRELEKSGANFADADSLVADLRRIKDADEIARMRRSFALNHELMAHVGSRLANLESGLTEAVLAWEIERYFREHGASEPAFSGIVAYNRNAALPHCIPSDKVIIRSEGLVLVDVGCRVADYCSDQTRTMWTGRHPSDDFLRTMELVREAQRRGIAAIRPGVRCCDVYAAAWDYFAEHRVEAHFNHGLGHGIGLETHEAPSLNRRNETVLQPGMCVTVEPGLYYPEWGGIRWEYTVLVTEDGCEVL